MVEFETSVNKLILFLAWQWNRAHIVKTEFRSPSNQKQEETTERSNEESRANKNVVYTRQLFGLLDDKNETIFAFAQVKISVKTVPKTRRTLNCVKLSQATNRFQLKIRRKIANSAGNGEKSMKDDKRR